MIGGASVKLPHPPNSCPDDFYVFANYDFMGKICQGEFSIFTIMSLLCGLGYIGIPWKIYRGHKTTLKKLVLSFCHRSPGDETQVLWTGRK